jgi:hypothetical protein
MGDFRWIRAALAVCLVRGGLPAHSGILTVFRTVAKNSLIFRFQKISKKFSGKKKSKKNPKKSGREKEKMKN